MTIEIQLTRGYTAIVDDIDSDLAELSWYVNGNDAKANYAARKDKNHKVYLHRMILEREINRPLTKGEICDHIDGDVHNNQRSNLRLTDRLGNARNAQRRTTGKSDYKGVSYFKRDGTWKAQIRIDKKNTHLGYFDTAEEAHAAYCEAGRKYFGEFFNPGDNS